MDPRTTIDRSIPTTAAHRGGRRLAAAVAGAALAVTVGALPAQAEPAGSAADGATAEDFMTTGIAPWTEEHGVPLGSLAMQSRNLYVLRSHYNFTAEDISVTVAPSDETGMPSGPETAVPFTFREEVAGGRIDVNEARKLLGEDAHGNVRLQAYAGDVPIANLVLTPDADLEDEDYPLPVDGGKAAGEQLGDTPLAWTSKVYMTPGVAGFESGWLYRPDAGEAKVTVVSPPEHGEVVADADPGASGFEDIGRIGIEYYPEEGYTGGDSFTLRYEAEGKVREETYEIAWDAEVVDELMGGDVMLQGVLNAAEIAHRPGEGPAPADPEPEQPADPGAGDGGSDEEHTVPDKVDTGGSADLALGATAAFGAAALIGATLLGRRRTAER